LTRFSL